MKVRSNRLFDLVMALLSSWLGLAGIQSSGDGSIYQRQCTGRSGLVCELAKSARQFEIFGLNPVELVLAACVVIFAAYCARRFVRGWTARIDGEVLIVPRMIFGFDRSSTAEITSVEVKPKLFGTTATVNFYTRANRKLSAPNARLEDANKIAGFFRN